MTTHHLTNPHRTHQAHTHTHPHHLPPSTVPPVRLSASQPPLTLRTCVRVSLGFPRVASVGVVGAWGVRSLARRVLVVV
jgi:hypothetical protein